MSSITAANAVLTLAIPGLFDAPQTLRGFSADNIYSTDPIERTQVLMGVDGKQSAGFVFAAVRQTITLQADSLSNALFDLWQQTMQQQQDALIAQGNTTLLAVGQRFVMQNGSLVTASPMPSAARTLQPRQFIISWERVNPVPA